MDRWAEPSKAEDVPPSCIDIAKLFPRSQSVPTNQPTDWKEEKRENFASLFGFSFLFSINWVRCIRHSPLIGAGGMASAFTSHITMNIVPYFAPGPLMACFRKPPPLPCLPFGGS